LDTLRAPGAIATLVSVNLTPVVGILIFGWSAEAVLISYFVDTFLGMGGLVLLVMAHVTGNERGEPLSGWKDWSKAIAGLSVLGAIMALPMALPLFFVLGDDAAAWGLFRDRGFLAALAVQAAMSVHAVARMHDELCARSDDDRVLFHRFVFLVARWMTMFVAMVTGLVPLLGPTIGSFVLVVVYGGASVYFELFPERAIRFVRGKDAKPLVFEGDIEASARAKRPSRRNGRPPPS
jgi:hypothetical protein